MSFSRILIPILIIFMIFGLMTTLDGEKLQPGIKGTITDKASGKPIANAAVELPGTTFKTTTGSDEIGRAHV